MINIKCKLGSKTYELSFYKTSFNEGCSYHGIMQTDPKFRFYFTILNGNKIIFVPSKSEIKRQDAITNAILESEKVKQ